MGQIGRRLNSRKAMTPLRILVMISSPSDRPRFAGEEIWGDLLGALDSAVQRRALTVERLPAATEKALKQRLQEAPFDIFHFIGYGQSRSAQYCSLSFEDSMGRARGLPTQYLGGQLAGYQPLRLVVLQTKDESTNDPMARFEAAAANIVKQGVATVAVLPEFNGPAALVFTRGFYLALAAGKTAGDALAAAYDGVVASGGRNAGRATLYGNAGVAFGSDGPAAVEVAPAEDDGDGAVPGNDADQRTSHQQVQSELKRKRACGEFDVFLCHNTTDKPAVKAIARTLCERGILPWLDEWELPPGQPWQPLLEQQIANIKSAAVFVGRAGFGPWQEQEMYSFLRKLVRRKNPVIPVLLADAPITPELPVFLEAMVWVDFRRVDPDPLEQLIWGITGRRPADF